jgi:hypothetical protein
MCYFCTKDDIFKVVDHRSLDVRRKRALELKALLANVKEGETCQTGNTIVERIKEEQYELSKNL